MDVSVGDKVQIVDGGIDVTNGGKARAGRLYGQGGPLWATVEKIVDGWNTGGRWGLPNSVTKVRCSNNGVVVWQVQPQHIYKQVVQTSEPTPVPDPPPPPPVPKPAIATYEDIAREKVNIDIGVSNDPFATQKNSGEWYTGEDSNIGSGVKVENLTNPNTQFNSDSFFDGDASFYTPSYKKINVTPKGRERTLPKSVKELGSIYEARYKTSWQNEGRREELLNMDTGIIQNAYNFPHKVSDGNVRSRLSAKYNYQFIPDDPNLKKVSDKSLASRLTELRASLGIPVHGNNDIARSVKFYMYNRFKVPDTNLAHNKTFTHIFFTRPDLNLLENGNKANSQTMNHTDTALLWRRNPELFKLLTDYTRCNDGNNFNMLLSNQVASFTLTDETLATVRAGRSWSEHEMHYAEQYTGRTAGTFTCAFNETSEFSIINLIKLWMTYIDNVSRGAWSPKYEQNVNCHVHRRALDYGASCYVFKCGPDGEDVLYWTKYFGIYPINSGASALSWDSGTPVGDTPKLNIEFAYSYKKDMSPISLLEFNHVANVQGEMNWVPAFDVNLAHCSRPYVGAPYIEMDLGPTNLQVDDVNRSTKRTQIRLKFRKDTSSRRTDSILFNA